jgi:hypothetical protein
MRHITIPNPVPLRRLDEAKKPILYGMKLLNEQNVWPKSVWREKGKVEMLATIYGKFGATAYAPGSIVSLTDEEYEVYAPLAILKGVDLAPDVAFELTQVMAAVINASSERPNSLPEQPEAKN